MSWAPVRLALMGQDPMRAYRDVGQERLPFPAIDGDYQD
jgi:hypothetical protein